jgi:hypothetical protein
MLTMCFECRAARAPSCAAPDAMAASWASLWDALSLSGSLALSLAISVSPSLSHCPRT